MLVAMSAPTLTREAAELNKPSSAVFLPRDSNTPPTRLKGVDLYPQMVYNIATKNRRREMPMPKAATKRINVTFPVQLLEDLDRYAPPRKRNKVIVAATENYVQKLRLLAVLRETAGAWDDESHPELATPGTLIAGCARSGLLGGANPYGRRSAVKNTSPCLNYSCMSRGPQINVQDTAELDFLDSAVFLSQNSNKTLTLL